jgi:hypothetical protein
MIRNTSPLHKVELLIYGEVVLVLAVEIFIVRIQLHLKSCNGGRRIVNERVRGVT